MRMHCILENWGLVDVIRWCHVHGGKSSSFSKPVRARSSSRARRRYFLPYHYSNRIN